MRCPNISHPWWQALVNKVGSDRAYLEYIRNGYDIPNPDYITEFTKEERVYKEIMSLFEKHKDDALLLQYFNEANKSTNKVLDDRAYARIADKYFNELSEDTQKYLETEAEAIDFEDGGPYRGLKEGAVHGSHITTLRSIIEEQKYENYLNLQYDLIEDESTKLLPGFESYYQQNEAINIMSSSIISFFRNNPDVKAGRWKKAVEEFKENLTKANTDSPHNSYKVVLDNIKELEEASRTKLQVLGLISKNKLEGISLDTYKTWLHEEGDIDNMEEQDVIDNFRDEWTFGYNAKNNALLAVKSFLAFIPRTGFDKETKQPYEIESFIPGAQSFMSYDEVYEQLKAILAGVDNTWEAMEAEMLKYSTAKPFITNILEYQLANYQGDKEQLKRQFVSTMSASYGSFTTVLIKPYKNQYTEGYYLNTIDTNQSSIEKTILATWSGDFKRTNLFEEDEEGNLKPDKTEVDKYLAKIKEQKEKPTISGISSLLNQIGIKVSEETATQLVEGNFNRKLIANQFTDQKDGLFALIENRLKGKISADQESQEDESEDQSNLDVNNPIVNNSAVRALARLESRMTDYYYSNTFKDGEGNTIYSYTYNKFLTKEFNKLMKDPEYVKQLLDITFNKPIIKSNGDVLYRTWLHELDTNPVFKTVFNISPFDTVKLQAPGRDGTKLSDMSDLDLELSKIAFIQNSGASKKGVGRIVKYLLTVPSKTTSYIVQGTGVDLKVLFNSKGQYNFDPTTKDALYSIVASEHNRILSQQARKSSNKAYDAGSGLFYFFPELNEDKKLFDEKDGTIKLPTDRIDANTTVEQYLRQQVLNIVHDTILKKIADWTKLGIIDKNGLDLVDLNYKKNILTPQLDLNDANYKNNLVTLAAADFVVQSMLAKFNTHQTFIDDPALYYKKESDPKSVHETWANISKRLTNLIAPFKDGMIDHTNKYFLSVKLVDASVKALNYAQLNRRLSQYYEDNNIELPYLKIDGTDAQEYTTLREDIKVQYMYGKINTDTYNHILERIDKEGDDLVLSPKELKKLFGGKIDFGPNKPVYSSRRIEKDDDVVYREYIKSASIPLLPQFTKGLEIDKLRKGMEKLEKGNLSVRAVFDSGTKLGGKGSINIWNEDGTIKDNLDLSKHAITLDRSNFGIQQEIPLDPSKDEVVKSTQATKLLFDALQDVTGFKYQGKTINGTQLQEIYTQLHQQLYEKGLKSLEEELVKDGILNMPALSEMLIKEGIERGYSQAQLSFLKLNPEKTDFNIPFWAHIFNDKEQALLTSYYTNKVLRQKMPGGSYVLVSEEGIVGKSNAIIYVGSNKTETIDKTYRELLDANLTVVQEKQTVTVTSIDPTDGNSVIEEKQADTVIAEIKKQNKRLDDLLNCLNK